MSNSIQLDSILMSNFIQLNFGETDFLSGEEGIGKKSQKLLLGSDRKSYLVRVCLLYVCDWLKCSEEFDGLAKDIGES